MSNINNYKKVHKKGWYLAIKHFNSKDNYVNLIMSCLEFEIFNIGYNSLKVIDADNRIYKPYEPIDDELIEIILDKHFGKNIREYAEKPKKEYLEAFFKGIKDEINCEFDEQDSREVDYHCYKAGRDYFLRFKRSPREYLSELMLNENQIYMKINELVSNFSIKNQ